MNDMFDFNRDGKLDSFERMMEYDFIPASEQEESKGGFHRPTGSSSGKASWGMFFLAILFGMILPPIGVLLMIVAIVMAILE